MKRNNFEGFSCDDLIKMLDEHLLEGWSQTSFPARINMTFSTFHSKKIRDQILHYIMNQKELISVEDYISMV